MSVGRGLEAILQSHPQLSQHTVSGLNYSSNNDVDVTINAFPDSLSMCVCGGGGGGVGGGGLAAKL